MKHVFFAFCFVACFQSAAFAVVLPLAQWDLNDNRMYALGDSPFTTTVVIVPNTLLGYDRMQMGNDQYGDYSTFYGIAATKYSASVVISNQNMMYSKLTTIEDKIAKMDPLVITQTMSFLVGAFVAMAFVAAVQMRF